MACGIQHGDWFSGNKFLLPIEDLSFHCLFFQILSARLDYFTRSGHAIFFEGTNYIFFSQK